MENNETTEEIIFDAVRPLSSSVTIQPMNHIQAEGTSGEESCPTCTSKSSAPAKYIYAMGQIQPRFPSVGIEKEFAQATKMNNSAGLTDRENLYTVLSDPMNRYLARKLCWVFIIEGLETYLLQPMEAASLDLLIESLNPQHKASDINVVIGFLGPLASPRACNGLQIPLVGFDQLYSFDVDTLIKSIPKPEKVTAKVFTPVAEELFMRIVQSADNSGASDDNRALNYLIVRYHAIYTVAADCYNRNYALKAVGVQPSALSSTRNIVDIIFTYASRTTDVTERYFCRVDVTEEFPFLVSKMQTYIKR